MTSIFQQKDSNENPEEGFWQSVPKELTLDGITILHFDVVKMKVNQAMVEARVMLGDSAIYLYNKTSAGVVVLLKRATVNWKHFEPFVEKKDSSVSHGFKMGEGLKSEEFYTESAAKLDVWLMFLSKLCILADIKLDYKINKVIGKGSYAVVYQGISMDSTRAEYAIKRIKKSAISKSDRLIRALENEITALRLMNHPHIAKLYRVYESSRDVCLVQEFLSGGELLGRLAEQGKFPEETVKAFAQRLLETLHYMHSQGVVHRDLKPENLVFTSHDEFDFKIIDFGLAAFCVTGGLNDRCGSPGYVAPEVLDNQSYDDKADVFSAGVVLFIMLTGKPPFEGETPNEVLRKNIEGRIDFSSRELDHVSIDFVKLLQNLGQVDPERRPNALQALQSRLFSPKQREEVKHVNLHTLKPSASKPENLGELWIPTQTSSISPLVKNKIRKQLKLFDIPVEVGPTLPPLRAVLFKDLRHPAKRMSIRGVLRQPRRVLRIEPISSRHVITLQR
jgi:serine/threonine protein kinase